MDLRVDPEQEMDPKVTVLVDVDTGEKRWYSSPVLFRMWKGHWPEEDIWAAGATYEDMFNINELMRMMGEVNGQDTDDA